MSPAAEPTPLLGHAGRRFGSDWGTAGVNPALSSTEILTNELGTEVRVWEEPVRGSFGDPSALRLPGIERMRLSTRGQGPAAAHSSPHRPGACRGRVRQLDVPHAGDAVAADHGARSDRRR